MIPESLLNKYGCVRFSVAKGQYVFHEGDEPFQYFQIYKGSVKVINYGESGQEFIQGIFRSGQSIAEATLFGSFNFPASAVTLEPTVLCKLARDRFFDLLRDNPDIHLSFSKSISKKLHFKNMVGKGMALGNPEQQIRSIIEYFRQNLPKSAESNGSRFELPFTRQQIADMTGLRVETVIRATKKLAEKGEFCIENHKIVLAEN